jgi:hypothetical protein
MARGGRAYPDHANRQNLKYYFRYGLNRGLLRRLIAGAGAGGGLDRGDAKPFGGPTHIEAHKVTFPEHFDAGCATTEGGTDDRDEGKLEGDFAAAMRADDAASASAVEDDDKPGIEVPWEAVAIVFVAQGSRSIGADASARLGG